ncbi:MAG: hypothetical protein JWQ40_5086 [Segetibacter sp.]|nr:hypothetical protein [Segetibacter sp.]
MMTWQEVKPKNFPAIQPTGGVEKLLETLIKPEGNYEQSPHELLKENKRRRKKQSRNRRGGLRQ